jgi:thiaminase
LSAAGNGTLQHDRLAFWLAQDRIYAAHAYPKFIGSLISNIPYSSNDRPDSTTEIFNHCALKILVASLENILREVDFFDRTAQKWNLDIYGWKERKGTRDYTAEMTRIPATGRLEDGFIFLWAMEKVTEPATGVHMKLIPVQ